MNNDNVGYLKRMKRLLSSRESSCRMQEVLPALKMNLQDDNNGIRDDNGESCTDADVDDSKDKNSNDTNLKDKGMENSNTLVKIL